MHMDQEQAQESKRIITYGLIGLVARTRSRLRWLSLVVRFVTYFDLGLPESMSNRISDGPVSPLKSGVPRSFVLQFGAEHIRSCTPHASG
jgi:hypothetical protein